ncbi:helix-turn-helix transcriptional regulator [Geodermatophilus sp. TF02-6]|uniref:LuxR C-terminal-related transcriptional regulator n=1 Tax=Geodermatophilus sp. TF02-6 TaxID=2250575 RepID=UPI000DEA5D5A|nr:LuxR family transcriptional regulator [Geodermatophilus sp. TF02-6]RBY76747.1 helix-turn-helix transcriptional regulator [Geodermatophilus sp. TF02-6]
METTRWPLVGREAELRVITAALTEQRERSLVITGPAGVGRTRLAREALVCAERRGRPTAWAVATSAAALVPLGALAHLLPAVDNGASGLVLLQRATAALAGDGTGPTPVLGVDDAHLLDPMSVTLLHQLAASGAVTLVLTVRTGAAEPDPAAPLWKDGLADRIQLEPLRRTELVRLVGHVLGGDADTRTGQRLWQLSRGNPLFLRELVEDGIRTGRLRDSEGLWRWEGAMLPSQRLCEIVLAQLGRLDAEEWRVLEVLATAEPLPARQVEALSSSEVVARLERRGVVVDSADGSPGCLRAAHPLYTEVVRNGAPEAVLRRIRRQLLDEPGHGRSPEQTAARCLALLDGGEPAPDAGQLTEAARTAAAVLDHRLAERLARAAIEAGGRPEAHRTLLEATAWPSSPAETERLAVQATVAAATDDDRAESTVIRVLNLACALGQVERAQAVLDEAASAVRSERAHCVLAATGAVLAFCGGHPLRAVEEATAVLSSAPRNGPARQLATAAAALGLTVTGAPRSALARVAEGRAGLAWPDRAGVPAFVHLALAQAEIMALFLGGRARDLESRAVDLHRHNLAGPEWCGDAVASLHCGWAALVAGRVRGAVRWLVEARAGLRRADPLGLLQLCCAQLAVARSLLGDRAAARQLVAELDDPLDTALPAYTPFVLFARAVVTGAEGHTVEATRLSREAARSAADQGQVATEAFILHATYRFGRPRHAADRLRVLARRLESTFVTDLADHVAAVAAEAGDDLDLLSRHFEEAGLLLTAADAAAEAAAAHERRGARRPAATAMTRAVTLARECGLSGSPSLGALLPPSLTAREEEVARLASCGLSNMQIADRLVVSVRTVEAHLSHIYGKLGITGRSELSDALVDPRPRGGPGESALRGPRLSARS